MLLKKFEGCNLLQPFFDFKSSCKQDSCMDTFTVYPDSLHSKIEIVV